MYDYNSFLNESRYDVYSIFEYFYEKIINFLEKNINKKITDIFSYIKNSDYRLYLMDLYNDHGYFSEMIINKEDIKNIKDIFYEDIMRNCKIGIRLTSKTSSGSYFKINENGVEKYCIVVHVKIPNTYKDIYTSAGIRKFKKNNNSIKYLLDLYKDSIIKKTLFHEFVHLVDVLKIKYKFSYKRTFNRIGYKDPNIAVKTVKTDKGDRLVKDYKSYANLTHEINAHILTAIYQAKDFLNTDFNTFKEKVFGYLSNDIKKRITNNTKEKFLKIIYDYYNKNNI